MPWKSKYRNELNSINSNMDVISKISENCRGNITDDFNINDIGTVYARVCVGKCDAHFESLHWKGIARKPISFVLSNDGLSYFTDGCASDSKRCAQALQKLGITNQKIRKTLQEGFTYRLGLFRSDSAVRADWDGIFQLVGSCFPSIYEKIIRLKDELKSVPFHQIEEQAKKGYLKGDTYFNIHEYKGENDIRYMTTKRLEESEGTLPEVYGWLYHYVGTNELFSGDGITKSYDGSSGCFEYVVPNDHVENLKGFQWVDLSINVNDFGNE